MPDIVVDLTPSAPPLNIQLATGRPGIPGIPGPPGPPGADGLPGTGGGGASLPAATAEGQVWFSGLAPDFTPTPRFITASDIVADFAIASFVKSLPNVVLLHERGDSVVNPGAAAGYTSGPAGSASVAVTYGGSDSGTDTKPSSWNAMVAPYTSATMTGTVLRKGTDLGADPTMVNTLTAIKGSFTRTASFTDVWTSKVRWGVSAAILTTAADILALVSSQLRQGFTGNYAFTATNQYFYLSWPKERGVYNTIKNLATGFAIPFEAPTEVAVTSNGVTRTYYLFRSSNTGNTLTAVTT